MISKSIYFGHFSEIDTFWRKFDLPESIDSSKILPDVQPSSNFFLARSLLSILRLASAVAKLKLADCVTRDDVQEAMRLVEMSKDSLKGTKAKKKRRQRPSDMIYQEIREMLPPAIGFDTFNIFGPCDWYGNLDPKAFLHDD